MLRKQDTEQEAPPHEVVREFAHHCHPLNAILVAMLNEHHSHRTERRGCGFTQASRHLAEYINYPGRREEYEDARLFAHRSPGVLPRLRARAAELGQELVWRNLDLQVVPEVLLRDPELAGLYAEEVARLQAIRRMPECVQLEESVLITRIMRDIVLPVEAAELGVQELLLCPEPLKIGTCPLAEKYFLELADKFVRRRGRLNIICGSDGQPLLIEKLHLGDDHSCISVAPVVLNGVCLPAGSLFGVHYEEPRGTFPNAELPGMVIPANACLGFRFLRLTTLSVSPTNRPRAFSRHFDAQVEGALFGPGVVEIAQLRDVARAQLAGRS